MRFMKEEEKYVYSFRMLAEFHMRNCSIDFQQDAIGPIEQNESTTVTSSNNGLGTDKPFEFTMKEELVD